MLKTAYLYAYLWLSLLSPIALSSLKTFLCIFLIASFGESIDRVYYCPASEKQLL